MSISDRIYKIVDNVLKTDLSSLTILESARKKIEGSDLQGAIDDYERILVRLKVENFTDDNCELYINTSLKLAEVYETNGDSKKALDLYESILSLEKENVEALRGKCKVFAKHKRLDPEAIKLYKEIIDLTNYNFNAYFLYGKYLLDKKQYEEALFNLKKITEVTVRNVDIKILVLEAYYKSYRYQKAITEAESILLLDPENIRAHYFLAKIYFKQGNWFNAKLKFKYLLSRATELVLKHRNEIKQIEAHLNDVTYIVFNLKYSKSGDRVEDISAYKFKGNFLIDKFQEDLSFADEDMADYIFERFHFFIDNPNMILMGYNIRKHVDFLEDFFSIQLENIYLDVKDLIYFAMPAVRITSLDSFVLKYGFVFEDELKRLSETEIIISAIHGLLDLLKIKPILIALIISLKIPNWRLREFLKRFYNSKKIISKLSSKINDPEYYLEKLKGFISEIERDDNYLSVKTNIKTMLPKYGLRNLYFMRDSYKNVDINENLVPGIDSFTEKLLLAALHSCNSSYSKVIIVCDVDKKRELFISTLDRLSNNSTNINIQSVKEEKFYICLKKLEDYFNEFFIDKTEPLKSLLMLYSWLLITENGSYNEINPDIFVKYKYLRDIFERITGVPSSCSSDECKWYSKCFIRKLYLKIYLSDIILIDYDLYLSDLERADSIFKDFKYIIFDGNP